MNTWRRRWWWWWLSHRRSPPRRRRSRHRTTPPPLPLPLSLNLPFLLPLPTTPTLPLPLPPLLILPRILRPKTGRMKPSSPSSKPQSISQPRTGTRTRTIDERSRTRRRCSAYPTRRSDRSSNARCGSFHPISSSSSSVYPIRIWMRGRGG